MTTRRDFLKMTALVTAQGIGVHFAQDGFTASILGGNNLSLGPAPTYLGYPADHWVEKLLKAARPRDECDTCQALWTLGEAAIPAMLDVLPGTPAETQKAIIECFGNMGHEAWPTLLQLMEHRSPALRAAACEALGNSIDDRLLPHEMAFREFALILGMVEQKPPTDHATIEEHLMQLGHNRPKPPISAEIYEAFQRRLDDSCDAVQLEAVEILNFLHHGRTPPPSIVAEMVRISLRKDNKASRVAAHWLEWHAPPQCSVPLQPEDLRRILKALDDPDQEIHSPAESLLRWLGAAGAVQIPAILQMHERGELLIGPRASCALLAMSADLAPRLYEKLSDSQPEVRKYSIQAVADAYRKSEWNDTERAEAMALLGRMIDDPDMDVAFTAIDEIDGLHRAALPQVIATLHRAMNHPKGMVRARVLHALLSRMIQQRRQKRSFDLAPVIRAAIQSDDPTTQIFGLDSLDELSDRQRREFAPLALKYMADDDTGVRWAAMTALPLCDRDLAASVAAEVANRTLAEGKSQDPYFRHDGRGIRAAKCYRRLVVPYLVEALHDLDYQKWALRLLSELGCDAQAAIPAVLTLLEATADKSDRMYILDTLSRIAPPQEAVPYLIQILDILIQILDTEPNEDNLWVFNDRVEDLASAASQLVPRLIKIMKGASGFCSCQSGAAQLLGSIGLPAMDALRPLFRHENPAFREAAVRAVGQMEESGRPLVRELFPALTDPDVAVRVAAACAIEQISTASGEVARRLLAALNDPCPAVADRVQFALWRELMEMSLRRSA